MLCAPREALFAGGALDTIGEGSRLMKVLAIVYGTSLAHVSRALEVARVLRDRKYEVQFAGKGQYLSFARDEGFLVHELPCIPEERIKESVRKQKLNELYSEEELEAFVKAELELYERIAPDFLLVDTRISASTSAQLAGLKRVALTNSHMTLYRKIPFFRKRSSDETALDQFLNRMGNWIEFQLYDRFVIGKMNQVRQKHGLAPLFSFGIEQGDLTLLADVPEFNPTEGLPQSVQYVGPLIWRNRLPAPAALNRLDPGKKCIYFTIGSVGLSELISELKQARSENLQFVVATGDARTPLPSDLPRNVLIERFINADLVFPHCDAVICHGGNGTLYQALSHGLPIVGVSMHAEQHYGLKRIEYLGLGQGFTTTQIKKLGFKSLLRALDEVLEDRSYRTRAEGFQKILSRWDGPRMAADRIEEFVKTSL